MKRRILQVGAGGGSDRHRTITSALADAADGDVVIVHPGRYGRASGEQFPLFVPPGVNLSGAGAGATVIDGAGVLETSFRPMRTDQSLVVLRDRSQLTGFTITGSGGSGVSVSGGGACIVSDNVICEHGLHGLLISAVDDVVVRRNTFAHNGKSGTSIPIFRPQPARPGEAIFVVCSSRHDNRVTIDGNDIDGSTAQESLTVISDADDDGARAIVRIFDNRFNAARVAVLLCASFGGSRHAIRVDFANNDIRGAGVALIGCGAYPVVRREAADNCLTLAARHNTFRDCAMGIQLIGAFGPARDNVVDADLAENNLLHIEGTAIRAVGAMGNTETVVMNNRVTARLLRNALSGIGGRNVILDGASMEVPNGVLAKDNIAEAQLAQNTLWTGSDATEAPLLVRQGPYGNTARLLDNDGPFDTSPAIAMWWE